MLKRVFDVVFSLTALALCWWLLIILYLIATINTSLNGLFVQTRIGRYGKPFNIYKFRTMDANGIISTTSRVMRRSKLDEFPQLINVLVGDMSFVGPRPDIPGYYDLLEGEDRKILDLRPGITSAASIKYKNEEVILSRQNDPLQYNDTIIFPDKVKMNLAYYYNQSFFGDIKILWKTVFG